MVRGDAGGRDGLREPVQLPAREPQPTGREGGAREQDPTVRPPLDH